MRNQDEESTKGVIRDILSNKSHELLILICHGNHDGTIIGYMNLDKLDIKSIKIFWIYACNSAKYTAPKINSTKKIITLGFITEVLAPFDNLPEEIEIAKKYVEEGKIETDKLFINLHHSYFKKSKDYLEKKEILNAALINHTRLNLRFFNKTQ